MEPKSIAFYTAVAVSILAVLSATTFPTMALAQDSDNEPTNQQGEEDNQRSEDNDSENNEQTVRESDSQGGQDDSTTADEGGPNQRLGLQPDSGIASCGQVVTEDVTLTSDLNCANGDGLIVGASDITINMNGYSITSGDTNSKLW
jgi:cytoskeletal protein RodZ